MLKFVLNIVSTRFCNFNTVCQRLVQYIWEYTSMKYYFEMSIKFKIRTVVPGCWCNYNVLFCMGGKKENYIKPTESPKWSWRHYSSSEPSPWPENSQWGLVNSQSKNINHKSAKENNIRIWCNLSTVNTSYQQNRNFRRYVFLPDYIYTMMLFLFLTYEENR